MKIGRHWVAVPLPLLTLEEGRLTVCAKDWVILTVVLLVFALGWGVARYFDRTR